MDYRKLVFTAYSKIHTASVPVPELEILHMSSFLSWYAVVFFYKSRIWNVPSCGQTLGALRQGGPVELEVQLPFLRGEDRVQSKETHTDAWILSGVCCGVIVV